MDNSRKAGVNATAFFHPHSERETQAAPVIYFTLHCKKDYTHNIQSKVLVYATKGKRDLCQNSKENLLQYKISSTGVFFLDNKDKPGYERGY